MNTEPREYTDQQTGLRLTVEYDIPEHPKITMVAPEENTRSIDDMNAALTRLMHIAGISTPEQGGTA